MRLPHPLLEATFLRRRKRFLADVRLPDGSETTVHCANPGAMLGCLREGAEALLSVSANGARKLPLTWELARVGCTWVGVNTARGNAVVREALEQGRIPELAGYASLRAEAPLGDSSRIDFLLEDGRRRCWVEVKTTTLRERGVAMFPDAVTLRGLKHVRALGEAVHRGDRAALVFLVSRGDCSSFRPAELIDPAYARALREAGAAGLEIYAHAARIGRRGIVLGRRLPADLTPLGGRLPADLSPADPAPMRYPLGPPGP